jgi:hypothetical protein
LAKTAASAEEDYFRMRDSSNITNNMTRACHYSHPLSIEYLIGNQLDTSKINSKRCKVDNADRTANSSFGYESMKIEENDKEHNDDKESNEYNHEFIELNSNSKESNENNGKNLMDIRNSLTNKINTNGDYDSNLIGWLNSIKKCIGHLEIKVEQEIGEALFLKIITVC